MVCCMVEKLFDLIGNLLNNGKKSVCIRGSFSDWIIITRCVPHSSVLGPALFTTYIVNDIAT